MILTVRAPVVAQLALFLALSGCSTLPNSGPEDKAIKQNAAVQVGYTDRKVGLDYALLDLNAQALSFFEEAPSTRSLRKGFGGGRGGAPQTVLGAGDVVEVSIFESAAGGLFVPNDAGSRPGNYVTLPQQTIDRSGTISVPYAGRINVSGRTTGAVQTQIEGLLANRAIEPQVLITIVTNRSSEVAVLGDVNAPAKLDINQAGERVLDMISRAGGLSTPGVETYVTLQRRGKEGTVLFSDLIAHPEENIYVLPGDTIYVNRERRTYLAFGASGLNGRIDFEESDLTLGEALGKAGGLLDARADPKQVFLYRTVDKRILQRMRIDVSRFHGDTVPVIFRANMRDPAAFFAVQKFRMADKDIIYVGNSDSTQLLKFLNVVTTVTGSGATVANDANVVQRRVTP